MGKKKGKKSAGAGRSARRGQAGGALDRFHRDLGRRVEELSHTVAWRADRELFPYSVRVQWPEAHMQEFLVVMKVVHEGKAEIAFHSGMGLVGSLLGMSDRYRAGKLVLTEDRFPPDNFKKVRKHVKERVAFLEGLRSDSSQGS